MTKQSHEIVVVGAGLVGSILAIFLKQRGLDVHLYEKRPDMRRTELDGGRSINLVITSRGLHALEQVSLQSQILSITTPVYGRMMHDTQGQLTYQSYSKDDTECNYSVSRAELNKHMLTHAEDAGVHTHFAHELLTADFTQGTLTFTHGEDKVEVHAQHIFATDGAGSATRIALAEQGLVTTSTDFLDHGYKELVIPASPNGDYQLDHRALHIWPRGIHMLMALPNQDGSFTVTLYLPHEGPESFASLQTPQDVQAFFQRAYPDALPLLPALQEDYFANPTGLLGTVWCDPWFHQDRVALLGDAAHGVVPFFGQGMNAGFEDCTVLMQTLNAHPDDRNAAFQAYHDTQKPNGDAIARMAIANFVEMRDHVKDDAFLLQKRVEARLGRNFPTLYLSKYSMVTHSLIPYHIAEQVGTIQKTLLTELCNTISHEDELDLEHAKARIQQTLTPFLQRHGITLPS